MHTGIDMAQKLVGFGLSSLRLSAQEKERHDSAGISIDLALKQVLTADVQTRAKEMGAKVRAHLLNHCNIHTLTITLTHLPKGTGREQAGCFPSGGAANWLLVPARAVRPARAYRRATGQSRVAHVQPALRVLPVRGRGAETVTSKED